jgi:hypothetical protein
MEVEALQTLPCDPPSPQDDPNPVRVIPASFFVTTSIRRTKFILLSKDRLAHGDLTLAHNFILAEPYIVSETPYSPYLERSQRTGLPTIEF